MTGLSRQGSNLFNNTTVDSLQDITACAVSSSAIDSCYSNAVKYTVSNRLFGDGVQADETLPMAQPPKCCTPTDARTRFSTPDNKPGLQPASISSSSPQPQSTDLTPISENIETLDDRSKHGSLSLQSNSSLHSSVNKSDTGLFGDSTLITETSANKVSVDEGDTCQKQASMTRDEGELLTHDTSNTLTKSSFNTTLVNRSTLVDDKLANCNNSNAEPSTMNSLGAITPGYPVCESSQIQRTGAISPSDKSTHYLSIGEKSKHQLSNQR